MAKSLERLQARRMRSQGMSNGSIAQRLRVSKASVSMWCNGIVLTEIQTRALQKKVQIGVHRGQLLGAAANRRKKESAIFKHNELARSELTDLTSREILLAGLGIYWGEGMKGKGPAAITNSDPKIIAFMFRWFRDIFSVPKEMFRPQIFVNEAHRQREVIILKFWSKLLDISRTQFRKVVFIKVKNKKVYENHDSYYGVLTLRVRKGTDLKYKIQGYLNVLGADTNTPT